MVISKKADASPIDKDLSGQPESVRKKKWAELLLQTACPHLPESGKFLYHLMGQNLEAGEKPECVKQAAEEYGW